MRVPIRSFREINSSLVRTRTGVPVVCEKQYRAPSTSSVHSSSSSANIRNIWSTCDIRSIALLYTTRRVHVLQYWYSHTSESVDVIRCRCHAIRGSVECTWYASYEYGQYRTLHIMVLLYSYRSTLASYNTWWYVSCHLLGVISTGTYFRNMTVSATSCVVSTKYSIFLYLVSYSS